MVTLKMPEGGMLVGGSKWQMGWRRTTALEGWEGGGRPKMEFPMLHLLFRHLLKMLTKGKMCHRIKTCQFRELGCFGRSNKPQNLR